MILEKLEPNDGNSGNDLVYLLLFRYSNGVLPNSSSPRKCQGNHTGSISPSTPPSIEEALKIIHDTERPHASLGIGDGDGGFFLHDAEPSDPPGAQAQDDDPSSSKARLNDRDPNSASTDEVDTGIHVRTEDIQSLDDDTSSLKDYSDIDPDCDATTRSCPLPGKPEKSRSREGGQKEDDNPNPEGERRDCPSSAPTLPRSYTASPASSSGGSAGGLVRMTSFAEQKIRKLEGRSSGGTTPDSSDLNVPYTHSTKAASSQVLITCFSSKIILNVAEIKIGVVLALNNFTDHHTCSFSSLRLHCRSLPPLRSPHHPETPPTS